MARRVAWIVLAVVVVGAVAYAVWPRGGRESVATRTRTLASELRCVDCEALSVADSSTESARQTRKDIERRLRSGQSEAEIRQVYVDRYGETVLLKPRGSGVGLIVWALPIAVVLIGAGGIVLAIRRGQRAPRLEATDADEQLVAKERAR